MSEWVVRRLDEVADRVAVKNAAGHDRVLTVAAGHGLVYQEAFFNKRVASADLSDYWVVEPGDFVYNKSTSKDAPWGVVARWDGDTAAVVTTLYIVFRPRPDVESDYLLRACNSDFFFGSLSGTLREGARAHGLLNVRLAEFFGAQVHIPTLPEQRRIVDVMAAVDAHTEALKGENDRLCDALGALRSALLEPQPHWREVCIGDVATTATGRAFPVRYQGIRAGNTPYFKVADMNADGNEREMRFAPNWVSDETAPLVKPRVCPEGTIVFPIIGAALMTEKRRVLVRESAFDQNVMGLVLSDRVTSDFMFTYMSNIRLGALSQTGAVPSVNQALVSAIPMRLPSLDEQVEIGLQVMSVHREIEAVHAELTNLRAFRSTLLTSLLNQEPKIPESYDAPQSAVS